MPTASELIVQTLEEAGVEYVFGIPGGGTGQIFQLLHGKEDRIKTILVRHEQTAGIMADAYGRATGKPAVVMGQGLFIGSNASFGIMEAMLSSSPMLVLTDTSDGDIGMHAANQSGTGEYGSIDLPNIFKSMTKYTAVGCQPQGGGAEHPTSDQACHQRQAGTGQCRHEVGGNRRRGGRGVSSFPSPRGGILEHRQASKRAPRHPAGGGYPVPVPAARACCGQRGPRLPLPRPAAGTGRGLGYARGHHL